MEKSCEDCKGSGKYVGLNCIEKCQRCDGTGTCTLKEKQDDIPTPMFDSIPTLPSWFLPPLPPFIPGTPNLPDIDIDWNDISQL